MRETSVILKEAANYCGLTRSRFNDSNVPTSISNIAVLPFLGDIRSYAVLSSMLLKNYRQQSKGSKYFILCGWPHYQSLFPHVDEYWSLSPEQMKMLFWKSNGFVNDARDAVGLTRNLHKYFEEVLSYEDLNVFYNDGFTTEYFERFGHGGVSVFKPVIPSSVVLGNDFSRELTNKPGNKVLIYPASYVNVWKHGRNDPVKTSIDFWKHLISKMLKSGFVPVIYKDSVCHDLAGDFGTECIFLNNMSIGNLMAAMRTIGCVLDVFSGISRLATLARTPFVCCDERSRYSIKKEYEFDDLCGRGVPKDYIFSFGTIISGGNESVWATSITDCIIANLKTMYGGMNRELWPPTSEFDEIVPYSKVRTIKSKRLGAKFIKIPTL